MAATERTNYLRGLLNGIKAAAGNRSKRNAVIERCDKALAALEFRDTALEDPNSINAGAMIDELEALVAAANAEQISLPGTKTEILTEAAGKTGQP